MDLFYCDLEKSQEVFWSDLLEDLNKNTSYNPYCYHKKFYEIFLHIIQSLLLKKEIILLDPDYSKEELKKLTGFSDISVFNEVFDNTQYHPVSFKEELINMIKNPGSSWSMTLFTSGTTGIPKKIQHNWKSITRFVKISERRKSNVWGFAYNPTHMAGIQVFFQALLNNNTIVNLFGLKNEEIYKSIKRYSITNISATPTFYRLLLPYDKSFNSVKNITSGGEKFDSTTIKNIKNVFPNAKITNVYASTEAGSLFASNADVFSIKPEVANWVKIKNNELYIHKSLMGKSEMNDKEWYPSGDLVEIISENPVQFRFISRKNEMINVGGYKVNPTEVEEVIRNINGIKDVRVYPRRNSVLGNIICCDVISADKTLTEYKIRSFLKEKLQEFKIPRMISFVDKLSLTNTGKIKRI